MIVGRGISVGNMTVGGRICMTKGKGHVERKNGEGVIDGSAKGDGTGVTSTGGGATLQRWRAATDSVTGHKEAMTGNDAEI